MAELSAVSSPTSRGMTISWTPRLVGGLLLVAIAALVILWPLGLGRDYMNHLARTYIQGNLGSDPNLQNFYGISFDFIPDLTMDLIIPWLSKLIGIYPAGAVTIWLAFVLAPLAGLALAKTLHGRVTWVSLLGFFAAFNGNMDWGFVNYAASSGLALFAFVLWIRMAPGWQRTATFALVSLGLVINHALAFLAFGFLVLTWEVISFAHHERGDRFKFARQLVLLDFPAMLAALTYLVISVQSASDLPATLDPLFSVQLKTQALFTGTQFGNFAISAAATLGLIAFFWIGLRQKWLAFAPKTAWLCCAFLVLVVAMPTAIFGIWGLHLRFTSVLIVLFAGCVAPTAAFSPKVRRLVAGGFAAIGLATLANAAVQMADIDDQYDTLKTVLADMPEGATLLNVFSEPEMDTAFTAHASALSVIERSAFVPNLFTNTSLVDVTPQMVDWHMPQAKPLMADELQTWADRAPEASRNGHWSLAFASDWPNRWDYLIYFKTPEQPGLSDVPVCEISATPEIILYKTGACR